MIHFHMQRFNFIDFMVIELRFFKKKKKNKMKNMGEMHFCDITHILHHRSTNFCFMVIFHTFFTLIPWNELQIEIEYPYIWFSMGIDHSNPYIHSTTVLCDIAIGCAIFRTYYVMLLSVNAWDLA